jgi:tRNA (guanine-N7-)-methyltransferase
VTWTLNERQRSRLPLGDWWKDEELPLEWDGLFRGGPLNVEVGFGKGEFLLTQAAENPHMRYVGLEMYREGFQHLVKMLERSEVENVLPLEGDAYIVMNLAFAEGSLHGIYVNYPDPWPKEKHARRRLFTEEFFSIAARKLEPGGHLFLATDDPEYAGQAMEQLRPVRSLRSTHPGRPFLDRSPYSVSTRYESRWIAEGRPLHYIVYERTVEPCHT